MTARTVRAAKFATVALAILGVAVLIGAAISADVHPDADAYWLAAQRLREGEPLYGGGRLDETEIYRYAPWFAFAWVPLTYLDQAMAYAVWRGILLGCTVLAIAPLLQRPTVASIVLAILLGGLLVSNLPAANVTPLIVGMLVVGLRTNVGPIILGLAGSLKMFPLLLVIGYVAERRWLSAAVAIGVTMMMWTTILAFDVLLYTQIGGPSFYAGGISLFGVSPLSWMAVSGALALVLGRFVLMRSRWAWLGSAAAIPLAVPRVWLPDAAYLLAGAAGVISSSEAGEGSEVAE